MSNSQFNKWKLGIENYTEVILNLLSSVIGNSDDETSFLNKLLSNNTQVLKIHKPFANGSSANTKFSKFQLSEMIQLGGGLIQSMSKRNQK